MIQTDPSVCKTRASKKTMVKALQEGLGFHQLCAEAAAPTRLTAEWEPILGDYANVFQEPR